MPNGPVKIYRPLLETIGDITLSLSLLCACLYMLNENFSFNVPPVILKTSSFAFIAMFIAVNTRNIHHTILLLSVIIIAVTMLQTFDITAPPELKFYGLRAVIFALLAALFFLNRMPLISIKTRRLNISAVISSVTILVSYWVFPKLNEHINEYALFNFALLITATMAVLSRFPLRLVGFGMTLFFLAELANYVAFFVPTTDETLYLSWATLYLGTLFTVVGVMLDEGFTSTRYRYHHH